MLLSVKMPHSGRDGEDYIEAVDTVRATLIEGKRAGAVDFFIGGDLNIELRLDKPMVNTKAWTVSNGTGCTGPSAEEAARIQSL